MPERDFLTAFVSSLTKTMVGKCDYLPFTDSGWDKEKWNDLVKVALIHSLQPSWAQFPTAGTQLPPMDHPPSRAVGAILVSIHLPLGTADVIPEPTGASAQA